MRMANVRLQTKFDSAVGRANLARSYRWIARAMVTRQSREQLLRMAEKLESRSRTEADESVAEQD